MSSSASLAEREPQQDRSRQSWERVLVVGMELFEEHGWSGLTITEVCRRAKVSAPSIYARVDGKAGLFLAVHERWLAQIRATEVELTERHLRADVAATDAAESVARVVIGVFAEHHRALRALIDRSAHDPELLARGSAASRSMFEGLAERMPLSPEGGRAVIRAVYAECLMRVMYGAGFLMERDESEEAFEKRVLALARTLVSAG